MAPTDNLFWVFLWSVYDRGWWTLSKPSQAKEGRKEGRKEIEDGDGAMQLNDVTVDVRTRPTILHMM